MTFYNSLLTGRARARLRRQTSKIVIFSMVSAVKKRKKIYSNSVVFTVL